MAPTVAIAMRMDRVDRASGPAGFVRRAEDAGSMPGMVAYDLRRDTRGIPGLSPGLVRYTPSRGPSTLVAPTRRHIHAPFTVAPCDVRRRTRGRVRDTGQLDVAQLATEWRIGISRCVRFRQRHAKPSSGTE